ncbi:AAA family ATPase [Dyella sp. Tek66A03]|uniref:AAA family ATPase n=1 Tax=Dyella sp. Tek66A03 TaxID=3458298 RepID=UPI00403E7377
MSDIELLLAERERRWLEHPVITESAILPTRPVRDASARITRLSRKARGSIAWWADPVTGKSYCIRAIKKVLERDFTGAGIVHFQAVEDQQQAEGRLLITILRAIGFSHKIARDLADKRDQVKHALIALSGDLRRIFIIIDEAQELSNKEFAWLKAVVNEVSEAGVRVTTILFGQRELQGRKNDLKTHGRSDLCERFMKVLLEFRGVRKERDFTVVCDAIDRLSEYPEGSGWTYARFLFPRAFDSGFRFVSVAPLCWEKIREIVPPVILKKGLPMQVISSFFAHLCMARADNDGPGMTFSPNDISKALGAALDGI